MSWSRKFCADDPQKAMLTIQDSTERSPGDGGVPHDVVNVIVGCLSKMVMLDDRVVLVATSGHIANGIGDITISISNVERVR